MRITRITRKLYTVPIIFFWFVIACGGNSARESVASSDESLPSSQGEQKEQDAGQATPPEPQELYSFDRLELQAPKGWDVSEDPNIESAHEGHVRVVNPDVSKFVFIRVSPLEDGHVFLPMLMRRIALDFFMKMSELAEFDIDEKGQGGRGDELWGRKGTLITFQTKSRQTVLPVQVRSFGQYLEETRDLLVINLLLAGEENGELEAIVNSIRVHPQETSGPDPDGGVTASL